VPAATKGEGLQLLRATVARFAANEAHFRTAAFDEESTREQFINALFDALGWDVLDREPARGPLRDVVFHPRLVEDHEAAGEETWDEDLTVDELAAREPVTRIPDYAFRVDGVTRFLGYSQDKAEKSISRHDVIAANCGSGLVGVVAERVASAV